MKLHDLRPAAGSRKAKRRVGRGIASGQGKTAGRGTKGQKARAGGSIPAWFEGGQTPLHQRIPKLRGFRNPFRIEFEVVNLGDIARLVELGVLESGDMPGAKKAKAGAAAPITVNQELLRAAGLVRTLDKPMKVLGGGELATALFVVADAFSATARAKIVAAGGTVSVLEVPTAAMPALALPMAEAAEAPSPEAPATPEAAPVEVASEPVAAATPKAPPKPRPASKASPDAPAKASPKATAEPTAAPEPKAAPKPKAAAKPRAAKAAAPKPEA